MKNMTLKNITAACHGTFHGDSSFLEKEITGVAIDSRKAAPGFLFVPLKGARVDGHTFIPQVMEQGALATLTEEDSSSLTCPCIHVESCEKALRDIAAFYRMQLDIKVVGITGSVGKTSTKETIASVLSRKYNVLKTEGNFNNGIGLPLTIFNLTEEHEVAVLEMGIDHFGEMHELASISQPDICVITNIGLAHMENLGSRDGILKAKTEVFDHLRPNASVILNGDDDKLSTVAEVQGKKPVFFGLSDQLDAYADGIVSQGLRGTDAVLHLPLGEINVHIPVPGNHMVYNALAGACVGMNGVRVNTIVEELRGEKIDIINWDENPAILIENALSPAKVISVIADDDEKTAKVIVPDYQLSLAIGKEGQNARLAAKLTGFKIDIKSETQVRESGELDEYLMQGDYEEDADTEAADEDTFDYEEAYEETSDKETEDMLNEEGDQE